MMMGKRIHIIGASIAGLSLAYLLLKNGDFDVIMYEANKAYLSNDIIVKCAGALGRHRLNELKIPIPREFIRAYIRRVIIDNWIVLSSPTWIALIIDRDEWQKWLMDKIIEMGARIIFKPFIPWINMLDIPKSDIIVGADGGLSLVRRWVLSCEDMEIWLTGQAEIENIGLNESIVLSPFKNGYVWAFDANDIIKIGLGIPRDYSKLLHPLLKRLVRGFKVRRYYFKALALSKPPKRLVFDNIALIGDAGLLCDPLTGGGIANAIISAQYLAKAIIKGDISLYDDYIKKLKRMNTRRWWLRRLISRLLDRKPSKAIDLMRKTILSQIS